MTTIPNDDILTNGGGDVLDFKVIGRRIKEERMNKGLSQAQLAEIMDISVAYVSRVEVGKTEISLKRLSEICDILQIESSRILEGANNQEAGYLEQEFKEVLSECDTKRKNLIYTMAKLIRDTGADFK